MTDTWVRMLRESDIPEMEGWSPIDPLDPDVLTYPQTNTFIASKDGPVAFLPVQLVAMAESLALKPELPKADIAKALELLIKMIVMMAMTKGIGELYFLSKDPGTIEFAKAHGFDDLSDQGFKTLRLKVNKIK